eukprot:2971468-Rhodomonas_salina.2
MEKEREKGKKRNKKSESDEREGLYKVENALREGTKLLLGGSTARELNRYCATTDLSRSPPKRLRRLGGASRPARVRGGGSSTVGGTALRGCGPQYSP